jgi:hypothetical protein
MVDVDVILEERGGKGMDACTKTTELYGARFSNVEMVFFREAWYKFAESLKMSGMRVWGAQVPLILPELAEAAKRGNPNVFILFQSHPSWVCYWSPRAWFYGRNV